MGITTTKTEILVDPIELLFRGDMRRILYELKYPHVPLTAELVKTALAKASVEDRKATVAQAKALAAACKMIIETA